jgi:hypothetical protein
MKIFLLDSSIPINSRNTRIIESLKRYFDASYISWDRSSEKSSLNQSGNFIYYKKSEYGNKRKKIFNLFFYFTYVYSVFKKNKADVLIASHWDMLVIGALLKRKFGYKLVYENLDLPDHENILIKKLLLTIERKCLKNTNGVIFASRFFEKEYNIKKSLVFENYPNKYTSHITNKEFQLNNTNQKRIAFIGTIRYKEILKNFINAFANNSQYAIDFYGDGPDKKNVEKFCKENDFKNIKFHGKYEYKKVSHLYQNTDFVWAAYPSQSYNVKHAIPNKFFESIIQNKIGIFSKETNLGDYVSINGLGVVVNPYDSESIFNEIHKIDSKSIDIIGNNIERYKCENSLYWEENEKRLYEFIKDIMK